MCTNLDKLIEEIKKKVLKSIHAIEELFKNTPFSDL